MKLLDGSTISILSIELSGGQAQMYRWLCCTNDSKLNKFATKHKADTYSEYLTYS